MSEKSKAGRPTKYKPDFAKQAEKLCKLGATNFDLANFFEVTTRTIERWAVRHDEFSRAIKIGTEPADDRVERSLFQKACGYTFESEKVFQFQGEIVRAKTVEHVPPDTTACIFWLKNRRKEAWRDKHEVDHNHRLSELTDEQLERIAAGSGAGVVAPEADPKQLH